MQYSDQKGALEREPMQNFATHQAGTLGWDTAFAVTYEEINAAIVKSKSSPSKLIQPPYGPLKFGVTADFGDWQITPGGDGGSVHFYLPLKNLAATYDIKGTPGNVTCNAVHVVVSVSLDLPQHHGPAVTADGTTLKPPSAGTKRHALKLRKTGATPNDPLAIVVGMDFDSSLSEADATVPIKAAVNKWLLENITTFEHIFAFLDLNDQIDTGAFAFCKPHKASYACCDTISGSSGFLAMLAMTSDDPVPPIQQVATYAIPNGNGASFLIRDKRFLLQMIRPGLVKLWPNLTEDVLELSPSGQSLRLKPDKSIVLPDTKTKDGKTYTPVMTYFEVEVIGNELKIEMHTQTEVSDGYYGTCTSTSWYEVFVDKNKKGEQSLNFKESRPSVNNKGNFATSGGIIAKEILTVISIVLGVLLLFLTDGAFLIVLCALCVVLAGQMSMTDAKDASLDAAPGLDSFTKSFTGPVTWTSKMMSLKSAGIHGSLQMVGDFS